MNMHSKCVRVFILLLTLFLFSGLFGCKKELVQDIYGPNSGVTDNPYAGQFPEPTERVKAKAEKYLKKQAEKVKAFWKKNQSVLDSAATQFCEITEQHKERKYFFEVAEQNLITSFVLQDVDSDEAERSSLEEALKSVSNLRNADYFERIYMNRRSFQKTPFCEFTGALKLFDGIGCYVSLAYFPNGEPRKEKSIEIQMLDNHWALLILEQFRNHLGETLPEEKHYEVLETNSAKQAWQIFSYWMDRRDRLDQIAQEMVMLCKKDHDYVYSYLVQTNEFNAFEDRSGPYAGEGPSPDLLDNLGNLDPGIITEVGAMDMEAVGSSGVTSKTECIVCNFAGVAQYVDGKRYHQTLIYSSEDLLNEWKSTELVQLNEQWYMSPG